MRKHGFNLIEIAIVLAVIGLVIGGIYIAASAVTENNRQQALLKQLIQIATNVRALNASQPRFIVPTYAETKAAKIFPADLTDTGSEFLNAYGGRVALYYPPSVNSDQYFGVSFYGLSQSGCISLWTKGFGKAQLIQQLGIYDVGNGPMALGYNNVQDGISLAEATTMCSVPGNNNVADFEFNLRG